MSKNTRRNFLKSAGATAAMGLFIKTAGAASPNDTIHVGCVGLRGRGKSHLDGFSSLDGVEVIAMCDVDERVLNERVEDYKGKVRSPVKKFTDFREMIEDTELDAVTIATPCWPSRGRSVSIASSASASTATARKTWTGFLAAPHFIDR